MFCAGKSAAPLAAGNTVVVKPPEQSPLSSLRLAELIGGLLPARRVQCRARRPRGWTKTREPPGCRNDRADRQRADWTRGDARRLGHGEATMLELGGKNALIAYSDADPDEVAAR